LKSEKNVKRILEHWFQHVKLLAETDCKKPSFCCDSRSYSAYNYKTSARLIVLSRFFGAFCG